ncbi:MAG TPA: DNA gyrase C-terminal beta-propeller domain-containing protein, partial [Smithellaceae bacterium]|nr:DNA gyrase C-terminal beta-propeller domain-containing protein [Smithellaceae bacterium]
ENIMLISSTGNVIRMKVQEIPINHRVTQGVKLIDLAPEESLVGVARTTQDSDGKDEDVSGDDEEDVTTEENSAPEE